MKRLSSRNTDVEKACLDVKLCVKKIAECYGKVQVPYVKPYLNKKLIL